MGLGVVEDGGGGALEEEVAAEVAALGADFEEVVGFGDDVEVVLNDDDGVALINEAVEEADEFFAVGEVEADGGLFEDVEVFRGEAAGALFPCGEAVDELADEFEALGFAA